MKKISSGAYIQIVNVYPLTEAMVKITMSRQRNIHLINSLIISFWVKALRYMSMFGNLVGPGQPICQSVIMIING